MEGQFAGKIGEIHYIYRGSIFFKIFGKPTTTDLFVAKASEAELLSTENSPHIWPIREINRIRWIHTKVDGDLDKYSVGRRVRICDVSLSLIIFDFFDKDKRAFL